MGVPGGMSLMGSDKFDVAHEALHMESPFHESFLLPLSVTKDGVHKRKVIDRSGQATKE